MNERDMNEKITLYRAVAELAEKYGFDQEEATRELARKRTTDGPKKKRGTTGYLLFSNFSREETKKELLAELKDHERLNRSNIFTLIAKKWKDLSDKDKEFWNLLALAQNNITDYDSDEEESKKMVSSGYILFSKFSHEEAKKELLAELKDDETLKNKNIIALIAKKWKELSDKDRERWTLLAEETNKGNITVEEALKIEKTHTIIDRKLNKEKLDGGKKLTKKRKRAKRSKTKRRKTKKYK